MELDPTRHWRPGTPNYLGGAVLLKTNRVWQFLRPRMRGLYPATDRVRLISYTDVGRTRWKVTKTASDREP